MTDQTTLDILKKLVPAPQYNYLVYGPSGIGKSWILSTARLPLLHLSFDKGGHQVKPLRALQEQGYCVSLDVCETNRSKPTGYARFQNACNLLYSSGFHKLFATVAIDSLSNGAEACLDMQWANKFTNQGNISLDRNNNPIYNASEREYGEMAFIVREDIQRILSWGCDTILTAHETIEKDAIGIDIATINIPGKVLHKVIPTFIDEVYHMKMAPASDMKMHRWFVTQPEGLFIGRSRLLGEQTGTHFADFSNIRKLGGDTRDHLPPLPAEVVQALTSPLS